MILVAADRTLRVVCRDDETHLFDRLLPRIESIQDIGNVFIRRGEVVYLRVGSLAVRGVIVLVEIEEDHLGLLPLQQLTGDAGRPRVRRLDPLLDASDRHQLGASLGRTRDRIGEVMLLRPRRLLRQLLAEERLREQVRVDVVHVRAAEEHEVDGRGGEAELVQLLVDRLDVGAEVA